MDIRQIVAGSAGFTVSERDPWLWTFGPVVRYAVSLVPKERPKICWLGTAHGDAVAGVLGFYSACASERVEASHLQLFSMPNVEPESHLLDQDVIWVHGGSVVNLLAVWRAHGVDALLKRAWERGTVLAGISAGSICWHLGGTTDSFGPQLRPVTNALGWLPFSNGVHYNSEPGRRPLLHQLVRDGVLPDGYATDDGVAIHYVGTEPARFVAEVPGRYAYRVCRTSSGQLSEERITPDVLPQRVTER